MLGRWRLGSLRGLAGAMCVLVGGCGEPPASESVDYTTAEAQRNAPFLGGTLVVTRDGRTAAAADPDRDAVFLVDVASSEVSTISLQEHDLPGRLVEGPDGLLFVIARGRNALLRVDAFAKTSMRRDGVCGAPTGMAWDPTREDVVLACRSGQLLGLDPNTLETRWELLLDDDLRDVVAAGDELVVTRFTSTHVIVVDREHNATRLGVLAEKSAGFAVNSGFRTVAAPGGGVAIVHQDASTATLGTPSSSPGSGPAYYVSSTCTQTLIRPSITFATPQAVIEGQPQFLGDTTAAALARVTRSLASATGPLDVAISGDGARLALLAMGNIWAMNTRRPTLYLIDREQLMAGAGDTLPGGCGLSENAFRVPGQPVAVAFDPRGQYVVQSRQPATLEFEDGRSIELSDELRDNNALSWFYKNNDAGVSCASCHPEGEEDGHTWLFGQFGARRTQSLMGGVSDRAPYHWGGELSTFWSLIDDVMVRRMGLLAPTVDEVDNLSLWLDTLPVAKLTPALDPSAVQRGAELFKDPTLACDQCHSGNKHTDRQLYDVATGGRFITPSLVGVGLRSPLMHDGCAGTLQERFSGCGGGDQHGVVSSLSERELGDLVAYLRSL